jgi:hypothetical protein
MKDGQTGDMMDIPPRREPLRLAAFMMRLFLVLYVVGIITAILVMVICWAFRQPARAATTPNYFYEYTAVAFTENSANAVATVMPQRSVPYTLLSLCSEDGYQSAWANAFPFLAAGMTGQVAGVCTPIQTTYGTANAIMVISLVGPNRPLWQMVIPWATQTLCRANIDNVTDLQAFLGTFLMGSFNNLIPMPVTLAGSSMSTQAQYQATDVAGGTDNVTVACPPGGPT